VVRISLIVGTPSGHPGNSLLITAAWTKAWRDKHLFERREGPNTHGSGCLRDGWMLLCNFSVLNTERPVARFKGRWAVRYE
jgi:hypothetical protein